MNVIECATCRRQFRDTGGTHECPNGHPNTWVDDEDEYPIGQVTI